MVHQVYLHRAGHLWSIEPGCNCYRLLQVTPGRVPSVPLLKPYPVPVRLEHSVYGSSTDLEELLLRSCGEKIFELSLVKELVLVRSMKATRCFEETKPEMCHSLSSTFRTSSPYTLFLPLLESPLIVGVATMTVLPFPEVLKSQARYCLFM